MTKRIFTTAGLALAGVMLSASAMALPQPTIFRLSDGLNAGPRGQNDGPGAEQGSVAKVVRNGRTYVVTVWMSSQVQNAPYQCKCSSLEMDPVRGPQIMADQVTITNNDGNRPCNHPKLASNGEDILMVYGTNDPNQATVQPYVWGLNHLCNVTTARERFNRNPNSNDGAADVVYNGMVNGQHIWTLGYLENNERSRAVGYATTGTDTNLALTQLYQQTIVDPANIGRPSIAAISPERSLFCSSNGDNRPPELGVRCAVVNSLDGTQQWNELIAASQPQGNPAYYMNQPQLTLGNNGRVFVQMEKSNGAGRNNNQRGSTTHNLYVLDPDDNGPNIATMSENIGLNQVHGTACSGPYGQEGTVHAAIYDSSITGSGLASATMVQFDVLTRSVAVNGPNRAISALPSDSGYLANLYGNNPNTQGRDFMRCVGGIENPGFGVTSGFRPDVQNFFVFSYAACGDPSGTCDEDGEEKLSQYLSFLPGQVPVPLPPVLHQLDVSVVGDGQGSVTSQPVGIDRCTTGQTCNSTYDEGTVITLTAAPAAGSVFVSWTGDCTGAAQCVVRMDAVRRVTATFTKIQDPNNDKAVLTVSMEGAGSGEVASDPAGVVCTAGSCTANFPLNTTVTLSATAKAGSKFAGFSGACSGYTCSLTLASNQAVVARFDSDGSSIDPTPVDPNNPNPNPGNNNPPAMQQQPEESMSVCGTTKNNSGAVLPSLVVMGIAFIISRRRRS